MPTNSRRKDKIPAYALENKVQYPTASEKATADRSAARTINRPAERISLTVRELERRLRLSADNRDWLTARFETGASVRTTVTVRCISGAEDEDTDTSQLIGCMHVHMAEYVKDDFRIKLGSFNLESEWPETGGRYSDLGQLSRDIDIAVSAAASSAGFSLWNAGLEDFSGSGFFCRAYDVLPM